VTRAISLPVQPLLHLTCVFAIVLLGFVQDFVCKVHVKFANEEKLKRNVWHDLFFRLTLRAIKDIACGEEITISYLSECDLSRSRHSRQKILRYG